MHISIIVDHIYAPNIKCGYKIKPKSTAHRQKKKVKNLSKTRVKTKKYFDVGKNISIYLSPVQIICAMTLKHFFLQQCE